MQALRNFFNAAFYTRNVPAWERALRLLGAAALLWVALLQRANPAVSALLVLSAAGLLGTASLGFCPACYFLGRRSLPRRSAS